MAYYRLLQELNIPQVMLPALLTCEHTLEGYMDKIHDLTDPKTAENAFLELAGLLEKDSMTMLACYMKSAELTREKYREMGISDEIFLATMGCFSRFLGETLRRTGHLEFDRSFWTWRQVSMRLFRIGELEFEIMPKEKVISLHIPSDSRITPENVTRSLHMGREFLKKFYPFTRFWPMGCESWLLSPQLGKLLKKDSNIRSFQQRFWILKREDHEDCLEWLFAVPDGTPYEELPEKTSLQRSVKAHLLSGGKIGGAMGLLIKL